MSTVVAVPPAAIPTTLAAGVERHASPRQFAPMAASASPTTEPAAKRARSHGSPASAELAVSAERPSSTGKSSPHSVGNGAPPTIKVKREPGSPSMSSTRPRPKRLDLTSSMASARGPQTARPSASLTSRDSAGLAIQDVGLACLSPGFQTSDPSMREQLQRSLDVRDQQRMIIEARQKGQKPGSAQDTDAPRPPDNTLFGVAVRTPTTSKRKGPPAGLSISAPSAAQFANDRVVQSAPMHQTFTGLRPGEHPFTRHAQLGPSGLSQTSHIHHVPAPQTTHRLPPIADVFAHDRLDPPRPYAQSPSSYGGGGSIPPPLPSPGFLPPSGHLHHPHHHHHHQPEPSQHQPPPPPAHPQQQQQQPPPPPSSGRSREFRSADEAVHGLSGGREELMPKVVHYGGAQPPTPPSPLPHGGPSTTGGAPAAPSHPARDPFPPVPSRPDVLARTSSMNGRRRGREEYERDHGSPPPAFHRSEAKRAALGDGAAAACREEDRGREREREREEDWQRGLSGAEKRAEFLALCERAWDLLHS